MPEELEEEERQRKLQERNDRAKRRRPTKNASLQQTPL
jgi:hypothetical protein